MFRPIYLSSASAFSLPTVERLSKEMAEIISLSAFVAANETCALL